MLSQGSNDRLQDISQDYAKTAIKAVALLNGGAIVALLTQFAALFGLAGPVLLASVFWTLGVSFSAAAWIAGHLSAQGVLTFERDDTDASLDRAYWWMHVAIAIVLVSLVCFVTGTLVLFVGFFLQHIPPKNSSCRPGLLGTR